MLNILLQDLFKQVETELKKEDFTKDFLQKIKENQNPQFLNELITSLLKEPHATKEPEQEIKKEESKYSIDDLVEYYLSNLNETFIHLVNKDKYVVLDVVNIISEDQAKFPTSIVYFDKQLKTTWCRPIVEFSQKFKQLA